MLERNPNAISIIKLIFRWFVLIFLCCWSLAKIVLLHSNKFIELFAKKNGENQYGETRWMCWIIFLFFCSTDPAFSWFPLSQTIWEQTERRGEDEMTTDISIVRWDPTLQQEIAEDYEYDGGNSSSRLFERSRIKALAGKDDWGNFEFVYL